MSTQNEWHVDLINAKVSHKTLAFSVTFTGRPNSQDFEGKPSPFPQDLKALEQVKLIRESYQAYEDAYFSNSKAQPASMPRTPRPERTGTPVIKVKRRRSVSTAS